MTRSEIVGTITGILEQLGARRAILFGSYARQTQDQRSDIDLLIVDDRGEAYADRIERYFRPLAMALYRPVEILVYTTDGLHRAADRPFVRRLLAEGIDVYEQRETAARL